MLASVSIPREELADELAGGGGLGGVAGIGMGCGGVDGAAGVVAVRLRLRGIG